MVVGTLRVATRLQVEFRLHNSVPSRRHAKGTSLLDLLYNYMYRACTAFLEFEPGVLRRLEFSFVRVVCGSGGAQDPRDADNRGAFSTA